jgi:nitroreductase
MEATMNETIKSIMSRRSTRTFLPDQLKDEEVRLIVDAGLYAPSATNRQSWHFSVVQSQDTIERLNDAFREMAKKSDNEYVKRFALSEGFHVFYNAPTVIIVSGDDADKYAQINCAAATENMLIAAESLGIGSCWIGFIAYVLSSDEFGPQFAKELGFPEGYSHMHAISLGYKSRPGADAPRRREHTVTYI